MSGSAAIDFHVAEDTNTSLRSNGTQQHTAILECIFDYWNMHFVKLERGESVCVAAARGCP